VRNVVEKHQKYLNTKTGEERSSSERTLDCKGVKIIRIKEKGQQERVLHYYKGLNVNQLQEFNNEYKEIKAKFFHCEQKQNKPTSQCTGSKLSREFDDFEGYILQK